MKGFMKKKTISVRFTVVALGVVMLVLVLTSIIFFANKLSQNAKADENSSIWVPVAQSVACNGFGTMFLPRIGSTVIISFINGNIVSGSIAVCQILHGNDISALRSLF